MRRPRAPAAVVLDRGNDARICRSPGRPRARAAPRTTRRTAGGKEAMKAPHAVIVSQNAPLEVDLRPRREAEALAAAGYRVTLAGGCRAPESVRQATAADVNLELTRSRAP